MTTVARVGVPARVAGGLLVVSSLALLGLLLLFAGLVGGGIMESGTPSAPTAGELVPIALIAAIPIATGAVGVALVVGCQWARTAALPIAAIGTVAVPVLMLPALVLLIIDRKPTPNGPDR